MIAIQNFRELRLKATVVGIVEMAMNIYVVVSIPSRRVMAKHYIFAKHFKAKRGAN